MQCMFLVPGKTHPQWYYFIGERPWLNPFLSTGQLIWVAEYHPSSMDFTPILLFL